MGQCESTKHIAAFERAFRAGFGVETDIRDCLGKIVIAHGFPTGSEIPLESVLELHHQLAPHLPLALHMNSCGLGNMLEVLLGKYPQSTIFCFGNPVPDLRFCVNNLKLSVWTTLSDICPVAPCLEKADGIWVDNFAGDWDLNQIRTLLETKKVCLIGEDLYRRPLKPFIEKLNDYGLLSNPNLMICTNTPQEMKNMIS